MKNLRWKKNTNKLWNKQKKNEEKVLCDYSNPVTRERKQEEIVIQQLDIILMKSLKKNRKEKYENKEKKEKKVQCLKKG